MQLRWTNLALILCTATLAKSHLEGTSMSSSSITTVRPFNHIFQKNLFMFFCPLLLSEKPHNPMINAGAILCCSLLKTLIRHEMTLAEKFDFTMNYFKVIDINFYFCCIFICLTGTFGSVWPVESKSASTTLSSCRRGNAQTETTRSASTCERTNASPKKPT